MCRYAVRSSGAVEKRGRNTPEVLAPRESLGIPDLGCLLPFSLLRCWRRSRDLLPFAYGKDAAIWWKWGGKAGGIGVPQQPEDAGEAPLPSAAPSSCSPKPLCYQMPEEIKGMGRGTAVCRAGESANLLSALMTLINCLKMVFNVLPLLCFMHA